MVQSYLCVEIFSVPVSPGCYTVYAYLSIVMVPLRAEPRLPRRADR